MKAYDVVAFGSCYVDTNAANYPFGESGIANETELVGGVYDIVPGGSAVNFCRLLATLGARPAFIGMAGNDTMGRLLEELLRQDGVEPLLVRRDDVQTNIGFNMTSADGGHIMCVAGTANAAMTPDDILSALHDTVPSAAALYLGGCFKLVAFKDAFPSVVSLARQNGAKIFVDHGRIPEATTPKMHEAVRNLVLSVDYYFASRIEFCKLWDADDVREGIKALRTKAGHLTVIVKDGADGAFVSDSSGTVHIPAGKVEDIVNLTGAGDSFNAGVVTAITAGRTTVEAVQYAHTVAAAKITGQAAPAL